jgi:hypothetical protein
MMISSLSITPGAGPEQRFGRTLKLAVGLLAILPLSFAFRPGRWVVDRPVTEDAYYALSVSRNIAEGKGVTIDGSTPTNGFQPLFVFACVPLFALAGHDRILAIRLVLGLSWVLRLPWFERRTPGAPDPMAGGIPVPFGSPGSHSQL